MAIGLMFFNRLAMLRLVNTDKGLKKEYLSKCRSFERQYPNIDEAAIHALNWIFEQRVKKNEELAALYVKLDYREPPKERINSVADELERFIARVGWNVFKQALVDYAARRAESCRYVGLDAEKWETLKGRFKALYSNMVT
jgi:hypothetical protein